MAIYPAASWRRLPGSEPAITARTVIFHTMVGNLASTDHFFRSGASGGIEAHFGVGGPWEPGQLDGATWQWRNTGEQADANLRANDFAVSIETADGGDPGRPWTAAQVESLVRLGRWLTATHGIPRRVCPAWDAGGYGWHTMFGAPGPWTPVAKNCPGPVRIHQLETVVLPRIFAAHDPTDQEDDMTTEQARQLQAVYDALIVPGTTSPEQTVDTLFERVRALHGAFVVPGTTDPETTVNLLFSRVRDIAGGLEDALEMLRAVGGKLEELALGQGNPEATARAAADELGRRITQQS